MKNISARFLALCAALCALAQSCFAFDEQAHRLINQLALSSLPANFPAFALTPAARERIAFLAAEPDRWRNTPDLPLKHFNSPDHYFDADDLPLHITPAALPPLRYDFVAQLALDRAAHPDRFPPIDPARNQDHTQELVGFLPWTMTEYYSKLKSEFSYLKAFQTSGGTPQEIANAEANIIYTMGVMGHFFGDAAQPLHTTKHYNGWIGDNPKGYTTNRTFHAWIDGGYIERVNIPGDFDSMTKRLQPARIPLLQNRAALPNQMFQVIASFVLAQNQLVEPLYQLEKEGKLAGEGELGLQGKSFIESQLVAAGQMLGDIWYAAWIQAPKDSYLTRKLEERRR